MNKYVEMGRTLGSYGVRGWIKIAADDEEMLLECRRWWLRAGRGAEPVEIEVEDVKRHGSILIAKWKGCDSPEDARTRRGTILIAREDFPEPEEGEVWDTDFIGCRVVNKEGETLGTVSGIDSNGVQSILVIPREGTRDILIPVVDAYVLSADLENQVIEVDWHADWS